jgi:hypothetical protein
MVYFCRFFVLWKAQEVAHRLPMIAGFVYAIATCPTDTRRLAIACGDSSVRVWSKPSQQHHQHQQGAAHHQIGTDAVSLTNKVSARVTAIDWFPPVLGGSSASFEGRLAFGTEEGRVGMFANVFGEALRKWRKKRDFFVNSYPLLGFFLIFHRFSCIPSLVPICGVYMISFRY